MKRLGSLTCYVSWVLFKFCVYMYIYLELQNTQKSWGLPINPYFSGKTRGFQNSSNFHFVGIPSQTSDFLYFSSNRPLRAALHQALCGEPHENIQPGPEGPKKQRIKDNNFLSGLSADETQLDPLMVGTLQVPLENSTHLHFPNLGSSC